MDNATCATRRLDRLIWAIIASVTILVLATVASSDFHLDWRSFLMPGMTGAGCALLARLYTTARPAPTLAAMLDGTAQIILFAAVGAPLSYLGAAAGYPLVDGWLAAADAGLPFDWAELLTWMNAHPALHPLFRGAYVSLMPQTVLVILALAWCGRLVRMRVFILSFLLATLVTILLATLFPAQGIWGHLGLTPADYPLISPETQAAHLPVFHGLRDGSFRTLMATGAQGIITFPSLHSALALILVLALWPVRPLRPVVAGWNAIMLVSIPIDGGHYIVDIAAGLAIAVACWWVALRLAIRIEKHSTSQRPLDVAGIPDAAHPAE